LQAWYASADDPAITWSLKDAMKQVDKQADDFESAMARVEITRASNDGQLEVESGTAFFNERGGIRVTVDTPESRVYLLNGRDLYRYLPAQSIVEEYYLPKHPQMLAVFLRLDFSATGRGLEDDYLVSALLAIAERSDSILHRRTTTSVTWCPGSSFGSTRPAFRGRHRVGCPRRSVAQWVGFK
jgi:hypothetical protein